MRTDIGEGYDISRDLQFDYTRLPDTVDRYRQWKLSQDEQVLVSAFFEENLRRPMVAGGVTIAKKEFYGISYNFWDQWYNVISIYDTHLTFQGYYSDILTPIQKTWNVVTSTDLFLDFFMFPNGTWAIKDADEFEDAVAKGYLDGGIEVKARATLDSIVEKAKTGKWPPECVTRTPADPVKVLKMVRRLSHP
jgi:predicted RNA-binding protein associated with RNAse of E/G family